MLIYFTDVQDTPASIAAKVSGNNSAELAKKIRIANANTIAGVMRSGEYYAPNHPIVIPIYWDQRKDDSYFQEHVATRVNHLTPSERYNLVQAMKNGHDVHTLNHAATMAAAANVAMQSHGNELSWRNTAEDWAGAAMEFKARRMEHFEKTFNDVKEKLVALKKATESHSKELEHQARTDFKRSFTMMQENYHSEIEQFKLNESVLYRKSWKLERLVRQRSIEIMNTKELETALRVGRGIKFVAEKFFILKIADDIVDTEYAYWNHGPWFKMACEDTLEVIAAIGISAGLAAAFATGGWVVVLGVAAIDVIGNTIVDAGLDYSFTGKI